MSIVLVMSLPPAFALAAPAPERPASPSVEAPSRSIPLRVQARFTTKKGEKKLSSIPYTMTCLATDQPLFGAGTTLLRFGTEVPVAVTTFSTTESKGGSAPATSWQYRNVGANIECSAQIM